MENEFEPSNFRKPIRRPKESNKWRIFQVNDVFVWAQNKQMAMREYEVWKDLGGSTDGQ